MKKDFKCTICCAYPFNVNSPWFVQQFLNDIFCVELQLSQRKIQPNWPAYAFIDENFSFQNWDNKIGMRSYIGPFRPFCPQALLGDGEKNVLSFHSNNKTFPIKIENLLKLSTQVPFASWQIWTIWCKFNQRWFNYLNHHSLAF